MINKGIVHGVLECWSVGVMAKGWLSFFQHSNTPLLQYSNAPNLVEFFAKLDIL
jgi:hypothetical protein